MAYFTVLLCATFLCLAKSIFATNYNIHIDIGASPRDVPTASKGHDSIKTVRDIAMDYYDDSLRSIMGALGVGPRKLNGEKETESDSRRSISSGGYTTDPDTCQMYNHNLLNLWNILTPHIFKGNHEAPNKMALHNIALIIQAYLEHHDNEVGNENNKDDSNVTESLNKINNIISGNINDDSVDNIIKIVLNSTKGDENCVIKSQRVHEDVKNAFQQYLKHSNRRRANINIPKSLNKIPINKFHNNQSKFNINEGITKKKEKHLLRYLLPRHEGENDEEKARGVFLNAMKSVLYGYVKGMQCL